MNGNLEKERERGREGGREREVRGRKGRREEGKGKRSRNVPDVLTVSLIMIPTLAIHQRNK